MIIKTKLNLAIDDSVIARAKEYAKSSNQSLSNMIEDYLKHLSTNHVSEPESTRVKKTKPENTIDIPVWLRNVAGTVESKLDPVRNKSKIRDMRTEKYLKRDIF